MQLVVRLFSLIYGLCLTPLATILQSLLLVDETGVPGENYRPVASY